MTGANVTLAIDGDVAPGECAAAGHLGRLMESPTEDSGGGGSSGVRVGDRFGSTAETLA